MKKKLISIAACCLMLFTSTTIGVSAETLAQLRVEKALLSEETTYGNGVQVYTTIYVSSPIRSARSTSTTVTADKTSSGKVNGQVVWSYTITGDFTYDGKTARASNPSDDYSIYDNWSIISHSVKASGASVAGTAIFTISNGVKKSVSPKITCSPNGKIS